MLVTPLLIAGLLGLARARPAPAQVWQPAGHLAKGQPAPAFRLLDAAGHAVSLADFRGKVVYLDFWFAGCRPCLAQAPAAARLKQQFRGRDVVFAYISHDTYVEGWKATIAQYQLGGAGSVHLLDPGGKYAVRPYGVQGFPTYVLIGRDGRVLDPDAPRPSDGRAAQALAAALAAR